MTAVLSPTEARRVLLRAARLERPSFSPGRGGVLEVLHALSCVQLDPIDRVGANADLVLHARVGGYQRGDWTRAMPRDAFEHFAKERCLLPARAFPRYRDQAAQTPWWRLTQRLQRLDPAVLDAVLAEIRARGPLTPADLSDHGRVKPLDWSGWKGTGKAGTMALEVLWTRCQIVTVGRSAAGQRIYDLPERALPEHHDAPGDAFFRDGLLERIRGAGLLARAGGPWWSMLAPARKTNLVDELLADGALVEVRVTGSRRPYLALPEALDQAAHPLDPDDTMRILGPLDPLLWNRALVEQAFGFTYVWEVYKPKDQRQWGYYVCPLLHRGRLVGRIEARRVEGGVTVEQTWGEPDADALRSAVERLAAMQPRRALA